MGKDPDSAAVRHWHPRHLNHDEVQQRDPQKDRHDQHARGHGHGHDHDEQL